MKQILKSNIIILCDYCVGKTRLIHHFFENKFTDYYLPAIEGKVKLLNIEDKNIQIHLWDKIGIERFKPATINYLKKLRNYYCIWYLEKESFDKINNYIKDIDFYAKKNVVKIIIGNIYDKNDLRIINEEEGKKLADENGFDFF